MALQFIFNEQQSKKKKKSKNIGGFVHILLSLNGKVHMH